MRRLPEASKTRDNGAATGVTTPGERHDQDDTSNNDPVYDTATTNDFPSYSARFDNARNRGTHNVSAYDDIRVSYASYVTEDRPIRADAP